MSHPDVQRSIQTYLANLKAKQTGGPPPVLSKQVYLCIGCGSAGPFRTIMQGSPMEPQEPVVECPDCGCNDVREEGEAISAIIEQRDEALAEIEQLKAPRITVETLSEEESEELTAALKKGLKGKAIVIDAAEMGDRDEALAEVERLRGFLKKIEGYIVYSYGSVNSEFVAYTKAVRAYARIALKGE